MTRIVAVSEEPGLAPMVARWLWDAFFQYPDAWSVEMITDLILNPPVGPEETFVLFDGGTAAGTASLAVQDLQTRQDLTPWLAGVFVRPEFRGRGHASALICRVEDFARINGATQMWLYTADAAPLYAALGWQTVGMELERGEPVTLMRRGLLQ